MKRWNALRCGVIWRWWIWLLVALVATTLGFLATQIDMLAADPLWYAEIAHRLAVDPAGVFASHETHPFVMRIGLTIPLSLMYRGFGVSLLVTNLPVLFSELAIVTVAYVAAPTPRAKLIAMIACITCVPMILQANRLNADLPSAALMAVSILGLSLRDRRHGRWWLIAAVVAWMFAFLVKETALWCVPVWIYALVRDVRLTSWRDVGRTYAPAIVVGIVLAIAYLALCAWLWGDPLARFNGIRGAVEAVHEVASYGPAWSISVARMTWQVPYMVVTMFRVLLVPVVVAPWLVRGRDRIWWVACATMILLYWFGSSTTATYMPLPISQRLIAPALPFVLVTAALATDAALELAWLQRWRAPIVAALLVAVFVPWLRTIRTLRRHGQPETAVFATLRHEIGTRPLLLVCGEPRCIALTDFYLGFEPRPDFTVLGSAEFARSPRPHDVTVRALVNRPRGRGIRATDPALDATGKIDAVGLALIDGDEDIRLYDAGDGTRLWDALQH